MKYYGNRDLTLDIKGLLSRFFFCAHLPVSLAVHGLGPVQALMPSDWGILEVLS